MSMFDGLPTLGDMQSRRRAMPKSQITPAVVSREDKRKTKVKADEAFRKAVWARDRHICRATGVPLAKSGSDPHKVGECDHVLNRSTSPDRIYDVTNGILISRYLNHLKKARCPRAPEFYMFAIEGPDDRGKPQTFVWRDKDGIVTRSRIN